MPRNNRCVVTGLFIAWTFFYLPAQQLAESTSDSVSFWGLNESVSVDTVMDTGDTHQPLLSQPPAISGNADTATGTDTPAIAAQADSCSADTLLPDSIVRTAKQSCNKIQDSLLVLQTRHCVRLSDEIASLSRRVDSLAHRDASPAVKQSCCEGYLNDRFSFGYEEGISFRLKLYRRQKPNLRSTGLSFGGGYQRNQQSDMVHRTLHEAHVKLGAFHDLAVFRRVRLGIFADVVEKMKQMEAPPLALQVRYNRYSLWITRVRAGALISIFCMEHFMISYRFGLEYLYSTPPYIVNPVTKAELIPFGKGIHRFGLSGSDMGALEMLVNNIGIYFYF